MKIIGVAIFPLSLTTTGVPNPVGLSINQYNLISNLMQSNKQTKKGEGGGGCSTKHFEGKQRISYLLINLVFETFYDFKTKTTTSNNEYDQI